MSTLESIEKTLEGLATVFDGLEEDAKGPEGTGNAVSDLMDKIKEGLTTVAKFFTALDQTSWFDIFTNLTETLEELIKLIGKFAGGALGLILKLLGKVLTYGSKILQGASELAESRPPKERSQSFA
jgi:hypothetical protein